MSKADDDLLSRFVEAFSVFDGMRVGQNLDLDGEVDIIAAAPWDERGWADWRPVPAVLSPHALSNFYRNVPGPAPPLYERLVLSYRWADVDVGRVRLLESLPPELEGLQGAITRDQGLFEQLAPAGFLQFGRGPDIDYDPVCFDLGHRHGDGDCPVVKFDHEEILCNYRLKMVAEVAPSFRSLVESIVADAEAKRG